MRNTTNKSKINFIIIAILFCIILLFSIFSYGITSGKLDFLAPENKSLANDLPTSPTGDGLFAGACAVTFQENKGIANGEIAIDNYAFTEDKVYTFLQGHRSYSSGITWSGQWCQKYAKGQYFSGFGCGLCCIANVYSTLSPYSCSPLDAYNFALDETGYNPTKSNAAIDWGNMKSTLKKMGFSCDVYYKAASYEEFKEQIKNSKIAISLVCSANDDTYWQNVPGHYVTICLYHSSDDTVFLGDPGSPSHNRDRIPLKYVYDALKTTSKYQYLLVDNYTEEGNLWGHDGITDTWYAPW